ncbi:MAG: HAD family hydrolase [Agathobacter sp.]|nr:HAD family hydrolase [Agathobacter sp.]
MKKGIIFDMDGTLWDSADNVAVSWNIAIEKFGYKREPLTGKDISSVMGKTMDKIAEILFPDMEEEPRKELLACCCEGENEYLRQHGGILYPKIRETMELLKKDYHLYIVSNCQAGYVEAFLDYYKLWDLVEDIECYGNNGKQKGENIADVCRRNQLDQAVYVGDIQGDYDATMSAGLPFIHAAYGFGTIDQEVPAIHAFEELPAVAKQVFKE